MKFKFQTLSLSGFAYQFSCFAQSDQGFCLVVHRLNLDRATWASSVFLDECHCQECIHSYKCSTRANTSECGVQQMLPWDLGRPPVAPAGRVENPEEAAARRLQESKEVEDRLIRIFSLEQLQSYLRAVPDPKHLFVAEVCLQI